MLLSTAQLQLWRTQQVEPGGPDMGPILGLVAYGTMSPVRGIPLGEDIIRDHLPWSYTPVKINNHHYIMAIINRDP